MDQSGVIHTLDSRTASYMYMNRLIMISLVIPASISAALLQEKQRLIDNLNTCKHV